MFGFGVRPVVEKIKILFLAANSADENRRRLEQEAREIRKRIRLGKYRDSFDLITQWAVRPRDLQEVLLEYQPHIVHFSGRGSQEQGIILEDDIGSPGPLGNAPLAEVFRILKDNIRLIVFNACYSKGQAQEFTNIIDYCIGMSSGIEDDAAISFSASFYQALAYARTVEEAFKLAELELRIEDKPDFKAPVFRARPGVDLSQPFLKFESEASASDLFTIERYAKRAREGLEPHILPRISRLVVREKYLPAILRGVAEGKQRVIPIIGPAGYGKSTILGDIYDELTKTDAAWVALVRCNDLIIDDSKISVENFALSLGEGMGRVSQSVAEIARSLTVEHGRGALLIDTLDIILNERLVPALRGVLLQLVDIHTTVVFTCRNYEYGAFLEPTSERLAGIVESIDRYQVPPFATGEIEEATLRFILNMPGMNLPDGGRSFARSILELSSDNRSLSEIIQNPLLLAMLCDLFGKDGHVPNNLTVSKLYEQYWEEKINRSRKFGHHSPEAMQKRKLCLEIAKAIFEMSGERLHEWMYESDLNLIANEVVSAAYAELLSEGVLKTQTSGKLHFFHQTFLEYAIARWLATRSGEKQKEQLLNFLGESEAVYEQLHWWPIIRQLLTIADTEEFDSLIGKLDISNLATFRTVAYAAASHSDASNIRKLLPQAFELGDEYQSILHNAIEVASGPLAEAAWEVTVNLVAQSAWRTAVNAAQTAGTLVARRGQILGSRISEALSAIEERMLNHKVHKADKDNTSSLVGWFLSAIFASVEHDISPRALRTLRDYYPHFSEAQRATVIRLHLFPGTSEDEQKALLEIVVAEPAPRRLKEELTTLLGRLLSTLIASSEPGFGRSLVEALHTQLPDGWDKIQSRAVGRHLIDKPEVLESILYDLFQGEQSHIFRNQITVIEALESGAALTVLTSLLNIPVAIIPARRIGIIASIVRPLALSIDPPGQEKLVEWLRPLLQAHPDKLMTAFVILCDDSTSVGPLLVQLMSRLPKRERAKYSRRILRDASEATISVVADELETQLLSALPDTSTEIALAELYRIRAKDSEQAISRLIELSLGESEKVARAASYNIVKAVEKIEGLDAQSILPLSTSRVVGVRLNWLEALMRMINRDFRFEGQDVVDAFAALKHETQEPVLQNMCNLTARWVRVSKHVPLAVGVAFENFAIRLLTCDIAGVGTMRALIITLKVIAQSEDSRLPPQISDVARILLQSVDLQKIDDGESETVDLLSAVARRDQAFLPAVFEDCSRLPLRNVRAVASAIKRVEGSASFLLNRMLLSDWCAPEVRNFILELRGI
jgi:hypothetical protein